MQLLDELFLMFSFFFPCSDGFICWPSVLLDAHQAQTKSTIRASVAWFRLISCWKLFRWGSHVFGHVVTGSSLLAHLTGKRLTSCRQSVTCLTGWRCCSEPLCQGAAWNMAAFTVCWAALLRGNSAQQERDEKGSNVLSKSCHKLKCWLYWFFWHLKRELAFTSIGNLRSRSVQSWWQIIFCRISFW